MKAVAIVCEYNPLHTGHVYHMQQARELSGADTVIGLMSGCFVQRAEPAVIAPLQRATAAIRCGMDAVIELPAVVSCGSGSTFADGAVQILSHIQNVHSLAMGVEDDANILQNIAEVQITQPPAFRAACKAALDGGAPYATAVTNATATVLQGDADKAISALRKPNNVLAVEYIEAIYRRNLPVRPLCIPRLGNGYNDTAKCGDCISATAARQLLYSGEYDALQNYIPENVLPLLMQEYKNYPVRQDIYNALTVHALRTRDVSAAWDESEGLGILLHDNARAATTIAKTIENSKSKRYTFSRLQRICLQTLLGITKDLKDDFSAATGRLIAVRQNRKDILREINGIAVQNTDYAAIGISAERIAAVDGAAGSLYALLTDRPGNLFWDRKLLTV